MPFTYRYDYTAAGVRPSVEDSLERLDVPYRDIVFVHDLSPDNGELGDKWTEQFEIAAKGAFRELSRMRSEGLIKAWGLGVNTPQPIMKASDYRRPAEWWLCGWLEPVELWGVYWRIRAQGCPGKRR